MKKWLSILFGFRRHVCEALIVKTFSSVRRETPLQVRVGEFIRKCGHPAYSVEVYAYLDEKDEWIQLGMFHEDDVAVIRDLLLNAETYVRDLWAKELNTNKEVCTADC